MGPKSFLTAVAAALTLTAALPAGAQTPADPPAMHERATGERSHWSGHDWRGHSRWGHGPWGRPLISLMLRHREDLGLSSAQVQGLEKLRADFMRETIRRQADRKLARLDLAMLMRPDPADPNRTVDLPKVEAKIRDIERLKADQAIARLHAIEAGKALLTDDQRAKLTALLAAPHRRHGRQPEGPPAPRQN